MNDIYTTQGIEEDRDNITTLVSNRRISDAAGVVLMLGNISVLLERIAQSLENRPISPLPEDPKPSNIVSLDRNKSSDKKPPKDAV